MKNLKQNLLELSSNVQSDLFHAKSAKAYLIKEEAEAKANPSQIAEAKANLSQTIEKLILSLTETQKIMTSMVNDVSLQNLFSKAELNYLRMGGDRKEDIVLKSNGFWTINYEAAIATFNDITGGDWDLEILSEEYLPQDLDVLKIEGRLTVRHNGRTKTIVGYGTEKIMREKKNKEKVLKMEDIHKKAKKDLMKKFLKDDFEIGLNMLKEQIDADKSNSGGYNNNKSNNYSNGPVANCSDCGKGIDFSVNKYSVSRFGKPLCRDCQSKN